jgi:hypothetical protein
MKLPTALALPLALASCLTVAQNRPAEPSSNPAAVAPLSQEQIGALIRQAADKDVENDKKQRQYTYIEREEEHKLDGKGQVKSSESRTHEIMVLYGEQVERLIAKMTSPSRKRMPPRKRRKSGN